MKQALCCGSGTVAGGVVGASVAGWQWKKEEVVVIMRSGLFFLAGAADEPQMDEQLLPVSRRSEVGVAAGRCVYLEVCRSKSASA